MIQSLMSQHLTHDNIKTDDFTVKHMQGRDNPIQFQPQLKRESDGRIVVCRRGTPISQAFTLAANRKEQSDSPTDAISGERFTNINVLESPPRQGYL